MSHFEWWVRVRVCCLMPLSTIFQLYRGGQQQYLQINHKHLYCIGGVIASMPPSSVIDCEPKSGKTKDYKIAICCFSAKHKDKEQRLVGSE